MLGKFLSRKFILSVGVILSGAFGVNLPWEVIATTVGYVLGEGVVDAARVLRVNPPKK